MSHPVETSSRKPWHERFGGWPLWDSLGQDGSRRREVLKVSLVLASRANFAPVPEGHQISFTSKILESAWVDFDLGEIQSCLAEVLDEGRLKADSLGRILPDQRPSSPIQVSRAISAVKHQVEALEFLQPPRQLARLDEWDDLGSILHHRILSPIGELRTAIEAKGGSRVARETLITSNIRLAAACTRGFSGECGAMGREDYLQEGILGLMRASEKFDPFLGFRFSTYATNWVNQKATRASANYSRTIRLPVHVVSEANPVFQYQRRYRRDFGIAPTVEEIAVSTSLSVAEVESIQRMPVDVLSLDVESVAAEWRESPAAIYHDPDIASVLAVTSVRRLLLAELNPVQRHVLARRFGLDEVGEHTLEEVGEELNVTRERVRQIQSDAFRLLKAATRHADFA